jgi:hypothetical protein
MLTQSKSTSAPPLSDEDLINFPVAVLHLFGANKAIDACLMSLLDRMHQLTVRFRNFNVYSPSKT